MTEPTIWTPHCVICARRGITRQLEHGHVCNACRHGLKVDLAAIPPAAAIAARLPGPFASRGDGAGLRAAPGSRPPLPVERLDPEMVFVVPRDGIRPNRDGDPGEALPLLVALEGWCRVVCEDRDLAGNYAGGSLASVTGFLARHVDWMADTPEFAIEDLAWDVHHGLAALRALDPSIERTAPPIHIPCPADVTDGAHVSACGQMLPVTPGRPHDDVVCPSCRETWTALRLLDRALADERVQVWARPGVAAEILGISRSAIERMATAGKVEKKGSLYNLGQAQRARRKTKKAGPCTRTRHRAGTLRSGAR